MIDAQEERLIEALTKVDAHGDVARADAQDPMTAVLRQKAIQADLIRWDDSRGHYVLTGTGRNRISARRRAPGVVVSFKKRDDRLDGPPAPGSRLMTEPTLLSPYFVASHRVTSSLRALASEAPTATQSTA